ncbi:YihY/virulence factor BrkB family protein [Salinibacterium sp. G-O1]|uniref:YihY/virulence factor BrkB family protein n=1 Tax=Salinibacterium sp. G-O1 TaxID=3046208 RepID=UPI0024B94953|nr:YihY/virulence factor BrkB family protein [Salinibacterium sp. G-O1]MDJ0336467.1 YihY/virulence factor BrkB family protein [Salinibacterium sp. G-O1]
MALMQKVTAIVARVMKFKPVRVFTQYGEHNGPLLAAGLSFQALFAVFAAIWVGFAIAGFVIRSNQQFEDAFLGLLRTNLPGLIGGNGTGGAINPSELFSTGILSWTGAIAAVGLLFTALGWLAWGRDAVRNIFGLPSAPTNFLILKLKDLGIAVGFGVALILSALLTVFSTAALTSVLGWLGIGATSSFTEIAARIVGLLIALTLDVFILGAFYRVVSGIKIPWRILANGTIIGAVALGVLKALGSTLLGGATRNPLLASFAVIIGLLIWFNLICQVILLAASWISVSAEDKGVSLASGRKLGQKTDKAPSKTATAL